jgi:tRNA pseudouridine38/39 synthase
MADPVSYDDWTKESLIERIKQLEGQVASSVSSSQPAPPPPPPPLNSREKRKAQRIAALTKRKLDTSKWSTRYVAFKLAYLGKNYGGYEHQATSDVPTIESELWRAFTTSRLINPDDMSVVDWTCCEYSKCGRTDRGVSSFGQVIGIRVRSKRPQAAVKRPRLEDGGGGGGSGEGDGEEGPVTEAATDAGAAGEEADAMDVEEAPLSPEWDPIRDEFEYCKLLNRLLPPDIRILAWCPAPPPGFSARFSCRERQYRYFFTQPAFSPLPSACAVPGGRNTPKEGWLDIGAMRDAARRFQGEHDFRNFCKVDPAKQISNYARRIYEADIEEVTDARPVLPYLDGAAFSATGAAAAASSGSPQESWPKVYSFNVNGSAFLWHQIRHMVSVLFMVGQGLEDPSVVSTLLDVAQSPRKPVYNMADEVPLVLWDCVFPALDGAGNGVSRADELDWVYVGDDDLRAKYGINGLMDVLWEGWRGRMMDEFLSSRLMGLVAAQGSDVGRASASGGGGGGASSEDDEGGKRRRKRGKKIDNNATSELGGKPRLYDGGNKWTGSGAYVPLLKRTTQPGPDEQNEKYAAKMGYASSAEYKRAKGYR